MRLTSTQHRLFRELGMSNLYRKPIYKTQGELGYTIRAKRSYDITVANDTDDLVAEAIVLMHELSHIYYGHTDIPTITSELKFIKAKAKQHGINYTGCMLFYGGPFSFLNIAMDLQINSQILTKENVDHMEKNNYGICTPEKFESEVYEDFKDYYIPLFDYYTNHKNDNKDKKDDGESSGDKSNKGKGSAGSNDILVPISDIMQGLEDEEEIQELLKEEFSDIETGSLTSSSQNQKSPDPENQNNQGNSPQKVEDAYDDIQSIDEKANNGKGSLKKGDKNIGEGKSPNNLIISEGEKEKDMVNFLKSIVRTSLEFREDPLRHYNRGTRRLNNNLLYNSIRRRNKNSSKKLGIVIDVSGSMSTKSIINAIKSLKSIFKNLHQDSEVVTWDINLNNSYKITNLPNSVNNGGGTDMAKALSYFVNKKFQDIVVYSDFETNMQDMIEIQKNNPSISFYSIVVTDSMINSPLNIRNLLDEKSYSGYSKGEYGDYFKNNKKVLILK